MINTTKNIIFIGIWSVLCTTAIISIVMLVHIANTSDMKKKVDELATQMECKENSCDRFKGKDAKKLEARLMAEIKKECTKK